MPVVRTTYTMRRSFLLFLIGAAGAAASAQQAEFVPLGFVIPEEPSSFANAVSSDGSVIAGASVDLTCEYDEWCDCNLRDYEVPIVYTDTMVVLDHLFYDNNCGRRQTQARALGVSSDATVIVGWAHAYPAPVAAATWSPDGSISVLDRVPGFEAFSHRALDASSFGGVIVGYVSRSGTTWPCRWIDGVPSELASGYDEHAAGAASAVSDDGSVVAGVIYTDDGDDTNDNVFRWTDAGGLDIIAGGAGATNWPIMTTDGTQIFGDLWGGNNFRWTESGGIEDLGFRIELHGCSADGERLVGLDRSLGAAVWTMGEGLASLADLLTDAGADVSGWTLEDATDISADGTVIVGWGIDPDGNEQGFRAVLPRVLDTDTDGDGLLDSWESEGGGIPYTGADGTEKFYVLNHPGENESDADPMHKDLFVELDMMEGLTFPMEAVQMIQGAFWDSPVPNPDGFEGITLHILVDHDDLPFEAVTPTPDSDWPADAALNKQLYFGTDTEQSDPDNVALLEAKAKAYRYAIQYNLASTGIGGLGERPGDDFVIFSGTFTNEQKAAVFMHELGHNLGLRHGGSDDVNMKPNYPSVMNYVHSYRGTWNNLTWKLDFSHERLASINESALDERVSIGLGGSGFYDDDVVPFFGVVADGAPCYSEAEWEQPKVSYAFLDRDETQDYNLDCDHDDSDLSSDLNYLQSSGLPGAGDPSPGELLHGHDDWANIVLPISDGGGAFAGPAPTDELTTDQLQWMNDNFPPPPLVCPADLNNDGVVNTQDFIAYLNLWSAGDAAADWNEDGTVNTQDFIAYLNDWVVGC